MIIARNHRLSCLTLITPLLLVGCSGGGDQPTQSATPATSATAPPTTAPTVAVAPTASLTPTVALSPLGGKPLSEEEKEYLNKLQSAKDLALAKNYDKAIPLLDELHTSKPDDPDVVFYLMLAHGSTEKAPTKTSKAYEYAQKVLEGSPDSRSSQRARSYVNSSNFSLPADFKYGTDTIGTQGNWILNETATYKTSADMPFHSALPGRLGAQDQAVLWETEASPATATGAEKLPKGTDVKVLTNKNFLHSLTSWRKPIKSDLKVFDDTIFDVAAMYVEVVSDGPLKGKKGWIVNQIDRYRAPSPEGEDEWGVWIPNRLKVEREADFKEDKK